jgi:hypothetical protein
MTTPQAARLYEAQHLMEWGGHPLAIHNPHNKPVAELPVIYGFNNGGSRGWLSGVLLAEDGQGMGGHACSAESYMPHDLGCLEGSRPDRHEGFRAKYPDGYRMEFISYNNVNEHAGLKRAYHLNQERAQADEESTS